MGRTYSMKPSGSMVRYQRASAVQTKICVGNIESLPAACTGFFVLTPRARFPGHP